MMINTLRLISVNLPHSCMLVYRLRNIMTLRHKCLYKENQPAWKAAALRVTWVQSDVLHTPVI